MQTLRDLKPANILLMAATKKSGAIDKDKDNSTESIMATFIEGNYVAKISDMGLGKMLAGQSSFGGSTLADPSFRGQSNGGGNSIGPGTTGWQSPECMAIRQTVNSYSSDSGDASPLDEIQSSNSSRVSRSADIFSLGCIFYSVLVPGSHPFGEWYEREANIMHNRPCIDKLKELSVEAYDLVYAMIQRNPRNRPTAKQICEHPFFWSLSRKLAFICDLSDRLETDTTGSTSVETEPSSLLFAQNPLAIERNAASVVGIAWDKVLYDDLISNVQRFRAYDPCSIRDLLRLIRNKHHHFDELPPEVRQKVGSNTEGLMNYFETVFPKLLLHCYKVCGALLHADDPLVQKYSISIQSFNNTALKIHPSQSSPSSSTLESTPQVDTEAEQSEQVTSDSHEVTIPASASPSPSMASQTTSVSVPEPDAGGLSTKSSPEKEEAGPIVVEANSEKSSDLPPQEPQLVDSPECRKDAQLTTPSEGKDFALENSAEGIIIWEGSTLAKNFNSRGWIRSDDEWSRRAVGGGRKRNANLIRCADDPKYRTRLCNHWDESLGTFCPMRRKNKCVFAHGPVELRVKEGKRSRWGKLVDKNGDNSNPNHSGGEDTYGAARSIETERKQDGKWKTGGKSQPKKGKKSNNKK